MIFAVVAVNGLFAQSGTIKGKVLDGETGEPIPFANVSVLQAGKVITGGMTDFDGKFTIKPVPAGKFTVSASYMGYKTVALNNLQVNTSKITFQDFKLPSSVSKLQEVVVMDYKVPLISKDQVESGGTISQEDIDKMPGRSASAVAATVGGVNDDGSGGLNVRGARSEGTVYYVDGIKVMGNTLPKSAIEQINVITGGLGAKYGDATGGIINITTKGASKEYYGSIELITSEFLDPYGYNLGGLTVTGPLFSKKSVDPYDSTKVVKKAIVGFLVTGDVSYVKDPSANINGIWTANDGVRESILNEPYYVDNSNAIPILSYSSNYFNSDKFHQEDANLNNASLNINTNAKVDINISDNLTLTLVGRYRYLDRDLYSFGNVMFNSENNGHNTYQNMATTAKITHKLSNKTEDEEVKSASVLKNVYYQLIGSYEKSINRTFNKDFEDDLFKYGHVGKFVTKRAATYELTTALEGYAHGMNEMTGFADTAVAFTASQYNPELASYTDYYYSLFEQGSNFYRNFNNIEAFGGVLNGDSPESTYNMFNSPGTPFGTYDISDRTQYIFSGNGSLDIGDHEFQLGFEFEQRDRRGYGAAPIGLWQRGRQLSNFHLLLLDKSNPIFHSVTDELGNIILQDSISYERLYSADAQTMFDYKFREHLAAQGASIDGELVTVDGNQFLDVDAYDPSELSIEYFSADELINEGRPSVSYFGYDVYGEKLTNNPTLDDFFNETNELGYSTRPIGAFKPNYLAFYIQDKFAFDDLVFRVGLRADRYDANQEVLNDVYSLHNTMSVGDVMGSQYASLISDLPSNIGDDYVVYGNNVNINDATSVLGYRTGDNPANIRWFNASGTQVDDPIEIASPTGIAPLLNKPNESLNASAFKDYTPQWNIMPRVAFSFPISDVALFSAHYDVMTKRPFGVNRLNPIQYLHLQSYASNQINNPNLMPETTIEYELGFQQKISNTSSLKLAAFYREQRDQAQVQNITGAYPVNYITYANIDFGTIKGMTLTYDLRRTGNIRATISYTLQFANGTGSDAGTALSLIKQNEPNLRTTLPLNYDQRHVVKASIDYQYGTGKAYDGPTLFGKDLLENAGVTFIMNYSSGRPFSKLDANTDYLIGSINGSRMPSIFTTNMKVYKRFSLNEGKDKRPIGLQVSLDVINLLNTFNVRSVYRTTGNPDDDAWLTTAKNQTEIQSKLDPSSFVNYYGMRLDMAAMYMQPRTIRLGLQVTF